MVAVLEVSAGVGLVAVFAVLACGRQLRRICWRRRRDRSRAKTRPTIPHLVALPTTREW